MNSRFESLKPIETGDAIVSRSLWIMTIATYVLIHFAERFALPGAHGAAERPNLYSGSFAIILSAALGGLRAIQHPVFSPRYLTWLSTTPWSSAQPLPFRRYTLGFRALFGITIIMLLEGSTQGWSIWNFPVILLGFYLFVALLPLAATSRYAALYLYTVPLTLAFCFFDSRMEIVLASMILLYFLVCLQLKGSVQSLIGSYAIPSDAHPLAARITGLATPSTPHTLQTLGFPYKQLSARGSIFRMSPFHSFALSLSAGLLWWAIGATGPSDGDLNEYRDLIVASMIVMVPIIRLFIYSIGTHSPLSLRGRLATGRYIIPGYDHVYVVPLLALVIGLAVAWGLSWLTALPSFGSGVGLALAMYLSFRLGPDLQVWKLTGHFRIPAVKEIGTQRI